MWLNIQPKEIDMWVVVLLVLELSTGDVHPLIWPTPFETQQMCRDFLPQAEKNADSQFSLPKYSISVDCHKTPKTGAPI
jgi:hypothetical protein